MSYAKSLSVLSVVVLSLAVYAPDASAQRRGGGGGGGHAGGGHASGGHGGGTALRRAAPRALGGGVPTGGPGPDHAAAHPAPRPIPPRITGFSPYRPYYYPFRPGITVGFYAGYGYPLGPGSYYSYPYGYYGYPYGYPSYYGGYGYPLPPANYVSAQPGVVYGGVRI